MKVCPQCRLYYLDAVQQCRCGQDLSQLEPNPPPRVESLCTEARRTQASPALVAAAKLCAGSTLAVGLGWGFMVLGFAALGGLGYAYSGHRHSAAEVITYFTVLLFTWAPAACAVGMLRSISGDSTHPAGRAPIFGEARSQADKILAEAWDSSYNTVAVPEMWVPPHPSAVIYVMAAGYLGLATLLAIIVDRWASLSDGAFMAAITYAPCLVPTGVYMLWLRFREDDGTPEEGGSPAKHTLESERSLVSAEPESRSRHPSPHEKKQRGLAQRNVAPSMRVQRRAESSRPGEVVAGDTPYSQTHTAPAGAGQGGPTAAPIQARQAAVGQAYLTESSITLHYHYEQLSFYGPGGQIPPKTRVSVISLGDDYIRIRTEEGREGFIQAEVLLVPAGALGRPSCEQRGGDMTDRDRGY